MNRILPIIGALLLPVLPGKAQPESPGGARAGTARTTPAGGSVSTDAWGTDYQIEVFGGTPKARVEFLTFSRDLRDRLRWLIYRYRPGERSDRDQWAIPIRIDLWGHPDDVFTRKEARTGVKIRPDDRFEIWVAARLHDRFREEAFRVALVRGLLVEQMLSPYAGDASSFPVEEFTPPPPWLVLGFDQLLLHKRAGRPSAAYSGVLRSGQILSPEEIFTREDVDDLDPISLTIFRMSSAALVEALLDQPRGDQGVRDLLADLSTASPDTVPGLLRQYFPAFREIDEGIRKWWTLQVADLGQTHRFEFMDRAETERWLSEALMIRFVEGEEVGASRAGRAPWIKRLIGKKGTVEVEEGFEGYLSDYEDFLDRPGSDVKLAEAFSRLQALKMTAFPLYRNLIDRYCEIIRKLIKGQTLGIAEELAELEKRRETIGATLVRVEDYLNYYEATQSPFRSREFDEYRKIREELERRRPPAADDPISRFMDWIESGGR